MESCFNPQKKSLEYLSVLLPSAFTAGSRPPTIRVTARLYVIYYPFVFGCSDFEPVSKPISQDIVKFAYRRFQTAFPDRADKILQLWNQTADLDASEQTIAERARAFGAHK